MYSGMAVPCKYSIGRENGFGNGNIGKTEGKVRNMPAVKMYPTQERIARTKAAIARYMMLNNISEDTMAQRMNVTKKTIQNRRNNPEKMNLEDLWLMAKILKCPIGELAGGEMPEELIGEWLSKVK